jgi:hypothetical protein
MKAAFVIERVPHYRLFSPIIDAALARGWDVECWHDHGQLLEHKAYQLPTVESLPRFRHGTPVVRSYQGRPELRTWMEMQRADAIVSTETVRFANEPPAPSPRPLWLSLQNIVDSFITHTPESTLTCDVLAMHSAWWTQWVSQYYGAEGLVADAAAYARELELRAAYVGMPELDAADLIDPEEVRHRWGIPKQQPVVVLFPFPQGVGRAVFWPRRICAEPSRVKQLASVIAHRRFEYWPHVRHGWNDSNVVKAIRRFCDRNGAYLLVKSRRKTPIPSYLERVADRCLYDESLYPPTVLEALSIADLSISYFSGAVLESVGLGVPHLCLTFEAADYLGDHVEQYGYFSSYYTTDEGSVFQSRHVSTTMSIPEAIGALPTRSLADFRMDPDARRSYVMKYLGHDDRAGSARTVVAIERALAGVRTGAGAPHVSNAAGAAGRRS